MAAAGNGRASRRVAGGRRVYRESQSESPLSAASVKQFASSVAPAAALVAATFGMAIVVSFMLLASCQLLEICGFVETSLCDATPSIRSSLGGLYYNVIIFASQI